LADTKLIFFDLKQIVFGGLMKFRILTAAALALLYICSSHPALAQVGEPYIHDPSTIVVCDGKYYTFGTGGGGLVSEDGWNWHGGAVRPGGGLAPDAIKIGDRYYISYASKGGGMSGGHAGAINTMWTKSLDPKSPDFEFKDNTVVVTTDGIEDCDAIDPSFLLDPTSGRLWLTYGTYFGFIRIVELDPKTVKRLPGNKPVNIAIDCEATAMMYRDGWYYLLGTHGTCCDGPNSTYNIVVGRSKKVTGPFLDNMGVDMLKGGGKFLIGAHGRLVGAGHFGLWDLGDGVQKFSCHYEADLDRSGRSVLSIHPLLWKDGWPVAGENVNQGTFEIQSERSGFGLELAVDFVRMPGRMRGFGRNNNEPIKPVPFQELSEVSKDWPSGNIDVRIGDFLFRPHQKWTITPAADSSGYLGSPFYKITIAGTERALAATADLEVITVPAFTGSPEQLWRIDQLIDGTYRIMPKQIPNSKEPLVLTAVGGSTPTLAKFDPKSDKSRWNFKTP
jgi:arabinan endo-1,5-alpha-L-arabinosidase